MGEVDAPEFGAAAVRPTSSEKQPSAPGVGRAGGAIKVFLDTDIGSDVDDAICLAYLLAQPRCELVGISTVSGEPDLRAQLASVLCLRADVDIPIAVGSSTPLLVGERQPKADQAEVLERWPHRTGDWAGNAIDLMRRTIRTHPNEVVLIAIGPLTNIALLCAVDPEAFGLLKGLVIMAGDFGSGQPEWNVHCDPHAAAIVFASGFPATAIGLNVTEQVTLTADEMRSRFASSWLLRPVLDLAEVWLRGEDLITLHDPVAAASVFERSLCSFSRGRVHVELAQGSEGLTPFELEVDAPHDIAFGIEPARCLDHIFNVIARGDDQLRTGGAAL
jgi:inosine-uridine nucleoside N-ribohydrolase